MKAHTESSLWKDLKKAIPQAGLVRHETRLEDGLPDCSYAYEHHGWIELKQYQWPKNPNEVVKFTDFKPQQKSFLLRRDKACGNTFLLAWIGEEYFWFHGIDSYTLGTLTRHQLGILSILNSKSLYGGTIYPILRGELPI